MASGQTPSQSSDTSAALAIELVSLKEVSRWFDSTHCTEPAILLTGTSSVLDRYGVSTSVEPSQVSATDARRSHRQMVMRVLMHLYKLDKTVKLCEDVSVKGPASDLVDEVSAVLQECCGSANDEGNGCPWSTDGFEMTTESEATSALLAAAEDATRGINEMIARDRLELALKEIDFHLDNVQTRRKELKLSEAPVGSTTCEPSQETRDSASKP